MIKAMEAGRSLFGKKMKQLSDLFGAIDRDNTSTAGFDELCQATNRLGLQLDVEALRVSTLAMIEVY